MRHSEETKRRISLKLKGRKMPVEIREKISLTLKGRMPKFIPDNTGRRPSDLALANSMKIRKEKGVSEETKLKMSKTHTELWATGKRVFTDEARKKMSDANKGEKSHQWKGGITPFYYVLRSNELYKEWRQAVFERDHFACVECGYKSTGNGDIQADHIEAFSTILQKNNITTLEQAMNCVDLWLVENGRTLCEPCHRKTDTWGGRTTAKNKVLAKSFRG